MTAQDYEHPLSAVIGFINGLIIGVVIWGGIIAAWMW